MQPQPDSQPIAGLFVPRLVARLHREGFDGSLRLHAGGATRVIYFRRGDIASAASNAEDDRLPSILIREGRLTGPQVEMAKQKQRPGVSLGKSLIELGFLTPSELLAGARRQVRQILAACFALADGTWQKVVGPLGPEVTNLGLPTRRLIFDALMESGDRGAVVREMGSMESIYRPAEGLAAALPMLRLDASMEEVARMTDGRSTLREVSGRTRLDDFTVSRIVLGLDILGLVELASRPEPVTPARPVSRLIRVEGPAEAPVAASPDAGGMAEPRDAIADPIAESAPAAPEPPPAAAFAFEDDAEEPTPSPRPAPAPVIALAAPAPADAAPGDTAPDDAAPNDAAPDEAAPDEASLAYAAPVEAVTESAPPPIGPARWATPDDTEADPPPFPQDELPAFATDGAPSPSGWQENPQTGERVHAGPIELTFDGTVGPGGAPSASTRRVVIVAALVVLVLGGGAALLLRRGGAPDRTAALQAPAEVAPAEVARAEVAAADPAPAEPAPAAHDVQPETGAPGATVPTDAASPPGTASPPDSAAPAKPIEAPEPQRVPPRETPVEQAAAPTPVPATVPVAAGAASFAPGQALLDVGDFGGAEAAFAQALRKAPAGSVTLQILIACDPATISKARAATGPGGDLFALPVTVKERACHRLLWGIYTDPESARSAARSLPAYFAAAGVSPVPVALARLRPSR